MNVVVALDHRFQRTPDGKIWAHTTFSYSFWKRYLEVFDGVHVVSRIRDVPSVSIDCKRADGEGVKFTGVPYYVGPWQYLLKSPQIHRTARNAVGKEDAVILRVSSTIASCIQPFLAQSSHPYAVEVVSDPYDVFAPGSVRHPLRPFFRWWSPRELRQECALACAAAYVTKEALQRRYPCPNYSVGISDVELTNEDFLSVPRVYHQEKRSFNLVTVGTLAQMYKAPDVLIDAVGLCLQQGWDLKLIVVGDGKHRIELEAKANSLGLKEQVIFCGQLSAGKAVQNELDKADLFVLPSYQEGLPRAMIEAMARGLPVIGSTVGGIPELLPSEDMVEPGDAKALAIKIQEIISNPERMTLMSARNLEKAKEYRDELLHQERIAFYRYVMASTKEWLISQKKADYALI